MKNVIYPVLVLLLLLTSCAQHSENVSGSSDQTAGESLLPSATFAPSEENVPSSTADNLADSILTALPLETENPKADAGIEFFPDDPILPDGECIKLSIVPSDVEFKGIRYEDNSFSIFGTYSDQLTLSIDRIAKPSSFEELPDLIGSIRSFELNSIDITEDPEYSLFLSRPTYKAEYDINGVDHKDIIILTENATHIIGTASGSDTDEFDFMVDAWLFSASLNDSFWWPMVEDASLDQEETTAAYAGIGIEFSYNKEGMKGWEEYTPDIETGAIFGLNNAEYGNISISADAPNTGLDCMALAYNMISSTIDNTPIAIIIGPEQLLLEGDIAAAYYYCLTDISEHHCIAVKEGIVFDIMLLTSLETSADAQTIFKEVFLDDSFSINITK